MKMERIKIKGIPSIIWGEKSEKVYIAVHGNMSSKEDKVIKLLVDKVVDKGYQSISFDLPEHGERKEDKEYLCKVQNCVEDLKSIINYAKEKYKEIYVFACSMGAYFCLLAYKDEDIKQCLFLSPVVNMKIIIDTMMLWSNTTIENLEERKEVKTEFEQTLYWDYYCYVRDNPIDNWNKETYILYGDKDTMQEEKCIREFTKKYNCKLDILENGEHYFYTKEQLDYYTKWLGNTIK